MDLRWSGRPALPQDVVGLTVVRHTPDDVDELIALMHRPHPDLGGSVADLPTGRYRGLVSIETEQRQLRLPSPVSLRINTLIAVLAEVDYRASRRQLVSAAVLHQTPTGGALEESYDRYREAKARDAAVAGQPLRGVLGLAPPKPGRRPGR